MKSTFGKLVVAYSPTEDAAEGGKAMCMSALKSTIAPIPARKHIFVPADTIAKTEMTGEENVETETRCWATMGEACPKKRQTTSALHRRQQTRFPDNFILLHALKWRILHVPKLPPWQGPSTSWLHPDVTGGRPTSPLH